MAAGCTSPSRSQAALHRKNTMSPCSAWSWKDLKSHGQWTQPTADPETWPGNWFPEEEIINQMCSGVFCIPSMFQFISRKKMKVTFVILKKWKISRMLSKEKKKESPSVGCRMGVMHQGTPMHACPYILSFGEMLWRASPFPREGCNLRRTRSDLILQKIKQTSWEKQYVGLTGLPAFKTCFWLLEMCGEKSAEQLKSHFL